MTIQEAITELEQIKHADEYVNSRLKCIIEDLTIHMSSIGEGYNINDAIAKQIENKSSAHAIVNHSWVKDLYRSILNMFRYEQCKEYYSREKDKREIKKVIDGETSSKWIEIVSAIWTILVSLKGLLAECFTGNRADIKFIGNTVGDGIITVVPEPELAGVTYLFSESNREDKKVLVIDIGGGTTDFSVLEYKSGKVEAASIGSCEIAGDAIDKLIFDLLPDGIPHSKGECRKWKEQLFAKILEGKITPFDTANLSRAITGQKITGEQFWIYYNEISNPLIKGIAIGKEIEVKVFDKIGKALQSALDDKAHGGKNPITGITTIFFVGGTSIITPLREKLVGIVADTSKSYCAVNFNRETDVVDMFGDKIRTLKADWDNPLMAINEVLDELGIKPFSCYKPVKDKDNK